MKKFIKRMTAMLTTLAVTFSVVSTVLASAVSVSTPESHLSGWGYDFRNSKVTSKAYDPVTKGYTNANFMKSNRQYCTSYLAYWKDNDGNYCYCVQHGTVHTDSVKGTVKNLKDHYPETIRKNLGYATVYAYKGTTKYGYSYDVELAASQVIIWNISAGYFDSTTTTAKANTNEKYVLDCIIAPNSTKKSQFVECYNKMKEDIIKHLTIPKGTAKTDKLISSSNTYTLTYNTSEKKWECEIKSNAVMKNFEFTSKISGVTFTRSGNNWKVSCTDAGAKTLASKSYVELKKTRATYSTKMEDCEPVYLSASSSQDKVSYNLSDNDPVEAYVAFEMSTGDLKIKKKINDNGEIKNANEYSYEYFDEKLNTNVKYTWDKSYKWDNSVSDWVEFKSAPTSNPTFSAGLRNIIRFRIKNSEGKYVVCNRYTISLSNSLTFLKIWCII